MLDELSDAIADRRRVRIRYAGDPRGWRRLEPHILYVSSAGVVCVEGMQVSGPSRSGLDGPAWRRFDLPLIRRLEPLPERFEPSDVFNPGDRDRYHRVIASCEEL